MGHDTETDTTDEGRDRRRRPRAGAGVEKPPSGAGGPEPLADSNQDRRAGEDRPTDAARGTHPEPGTYRIEAEGSEGVLRVVGGSTDPGARVHPGADRGGPAGRWGIVPNGDGTCRLRAEHSGKVLDSGDSEEGVFQWGWYGAPSQRWSLDPLGEGSYRIESGDDGTVLSVASGSQEGGAGVTCSRWKDASGQRWRLERIEYRVENVHARSTILPAGHGDGRGWDLVPNDDGTYRLRTGGRVLGVEDRSVHDGAGVRLTGYDGGDDQRWFLHNIGDGRYRIEAKHSGNVLAVGTDAGGTGADSGTLRQETWTGEDHQRWRLRSL